uniref:Uncharacterized protein n=1 Tax=Populus alba TaxID=43335 RepID=A0A4U5QC52_POPAL|nr:hypothetical protein D5086_0000109330 [Populus alba]
MNLYVHSPYSSNSIVSYFNKLVEDDELLSIVDPYLSPWVEACAIHAWPKLEDHFPFVYCVERLVYERKYPERESCFEELDLDPRAVSECYTGGYGDEDYEDFIMYICKASKGTATPKACSKPSGYSIQRPKAKSIPPVCYRDTIISTLLEQIKSAISLWMQ